MLFATVPKKSNSPVTPSLPPWASRRSFLGGDGCGGGGVLLLLLDVRGGGDDGKCADDSLLPVVVVVAPLLPSLK